MSTDKRTKGSQHLSYECFSYNFTESDSKLYLWVGFISNSESNIQLSLIHLFIHTINTAWELSRWHLCAHHRALALCVHAPSLGFPTLFYCFFFTFITAIYISISITYVDCPVSTCKKTFNLCTWKCASWKKSMSLKFWHSNLSWNCFSVNILKGLSN